MREFDLCKELSRKLAKDLGVTPISFGKTSLTHPDLLVNTLNIIDEDNKVSKVPIWYGEAIGGENIACGLLAVLNTKPEDLEFVFVLGFKNLNGQFQTNEITLSFSYNWQDPNDPGTIKLKSEDKWFPVDLVEKLRLVLGFEVMIQEGILWQPSKNIPEELRKDILQLIEVDDDSN
jgi:hypothetical protein